VLCCVFSRSSVVLLIRRSACVCTCCCSMSNLVALHLPLGHRRFLGLLFLCPSVTVLQECYRNVTRVLQDLSLQCSLFLGQFLRLLWPARESA
jgi:hypothetical protein